LLSVFGLIVLAYVVLTGHTRRGAEAAKRFQEQYDPPEQTLMQVAMEVIRGSNNPRSSIWCHSLLEDIYGDRFQEGSISGANSLNATAGGQLWVFPANFSNAEQWVGNVLTFVSIIPPDVSIIPPDVAAKVRPLAGISTRIVDYDAVTNLLHVVAPQSPSVTDVQEALKSGARISYIINGRPFSGTGVGYGGQDSLNLFASWPDRQDPSRLVSFPIALLVNGSSRKFQQYVGQPLAYSYLGPDNTPGTDDDWPGRDGIVGVNPGPDGLLGTTDDLPPDDSYGPDGIPMTPDDGTVFFWPLSANEDYDAPDYQNMFLAGLSYDSNNNRVFVSEPSFHRPTLLKYLFNKGVFNNAPDLKRLFCLRPQRLFHPNFDGSNPDYRDIPDDSNPTPWDVDNDGDGVPDSIWVDVGLPVRQLPDGRRYKPLAAILCVDLDGRLNLNAHGSPRSPVQTSLPREIVAVPAAPAKLGIGPAEIEVPWVVASRYASDASDSVPGKPGLDPLADWQMAQFPREYLLFPVDLFGATGLALDCLGQPLFFPAFTNPSWQKADNPYELDLLGTAAYCASVDSPFTPAELERLLRPFDADSRDLPKRSSLNLPLHDRFSVTTHSFDVPSVPRTLPPRILKLFLEQRAKDIGLVQQQVAVYPELQEFLAFLDRGALNGEDWLSFIQVHVYLEQRMFNLAPISRDDINTIYKIVQQYRDLVANWQILPWEILKNLPMDVNRPFGDSQDNNNNGVVDEVLEVLRGLDTTRPDNLVDVDFNGPAQDDAVLARQLYARHLYTLAMLLLDTHGYGINDAQERNRIRRIFAQRIAQWAVNCVDFRDSDSAMTSFEFDINPWNGWTLAADGRIVWDQSKPNNPRNDFDSQARPVDSDYGVAWGAEAPELLISEVYAFHDRRIADTAFDNGPRKTTTAQQDPDPTLDQTRIPQGSLFIELYCPRTNVKSDQLQFSSAPQLPGDLYTNDRRLDLSRTTPNGYPVWRLVVTEKTSEESGRSNFLTKASPENDAYGDNSFWTQQWTDYTTWGFSRSPWDTGSLLLDSQSEPAKIERILWFTDSPPLVDRSRSYWRRGNVSPQLEPGGYLVVGPRPVTYLGSYIKEFSGSPPQYGKPARQQIALLPTVNLVPLEDPQIKFTYPVAGAEIRPPIGLIVATDPPQSWTNRNRYVGISVSEPIPGIDNYYPEPTETNPATGEMDAYGDLKEADSSKLFLDTPLDRDNPHLAEISGATTVENHKTLVLQRVADPLKDYDPVTNPYLTVDWAPIDLTVFNGEDTVQDDPDRSNDLPPSILFASRERGASTGDLWSLRGMLTVEDRNVDKRSVTVTTVCFPFSFRSTFGFINRGFWSQNLLEDNPVWAGAPPRNLPWHTQGSLSDPALWPFYLGSPKPDHSFAWLNWNNRPYVSPMEVMLVPYSGSSRLLLDYSQERINNPYEMSGDNVEELSAPFGAHFGHLIDFFLRERKDADPAPDPVPDMAAILDFLRTSPVFVNSQRQVPLPGSSRGFVPPFDRIDQYREPGKVNLNTVLNSAVWGKISTAVQFDDLRNSRVGQVSPALQLPSAVANPFRRFHSAPWVPPVPELNDLIRSQSGDIFGVNVSLLRPALNNTKPLFAPAQGDSRNPFFHYRDLMRLGNLVTTRSNVYAIWVTIGYFEVQPVAEVMQPDPNVPDNFLINGMSFSPAEIAEIYPDGYMLGQELGSDTGEIKRHRAFFLFDRTIPVGFRRGYDLNVDQGLLIKRIIE